MSSQSKHTDPLWFKDAIIYELSVRAFYDSNRDGKGDFRGLIQKLDYLEDLGVNAVWLLPFYPSPLKDDGYDVTDHCDVHPDLGSMSDFKDFLKEAHSRGIRVITDLVINHTSDQHSWFRRARKSKPGSRFREFYVWSDTAEKYKDARVIIQDEEAGNWTWDPEAKAYYWHRFYRHQPELNFDNPEVQMEIIKIIDFWLKTGVDGFRLSSVPFLFEEEGTSCENLPQTHQFLRKLRNHIDKNHKSKVLMAEANLWPEDAAAYFGGGQECHMNFNYPLMPRIFLSLRTEDSYPIIDIMEQIPETPESCQWALFLRNHDELGLEMVTEEEKDYLFKAYANDSHTKYNLGIRRRLAPMLNNDRRRIELLYTILFSLPGTPIIYYGDEIGMGDNIYLGDRHGVRTPMQWNMNLNAGFSESNPQQLYLPVITDPVYRFESVNVATQDENPSSLMYWIRNVIAMRKRLSVFGRGALKFIDNNNNKVLSFLRSDGSQKIIVVANLSQFSQAVSLNLSEFKNSEVTEVFSQNRFNNIDQGQYSITVGPYGYFWFQLDHAAKNETTLGTSELPLLSTDVSWEKFFNNFEEQRVFERKILPVYIRKCRWFGGKAKVISKLAIHQVLPIKVEGEMHYLTLLEVHYMQRLPELYFLPMTFILADDILEKVESTGQSVIARAEIQKKRGYIIDSCYNKEFRDFLLLSMDKKLRIKYDEGALEFNASVFNKIKIPANSIDSKILKAEQSNTSVVYNDQYFFKFYRKLEKEVNPDLELVRFLSEQTNFANSPRYAGSLEFKDSEGRTIVFGLLQEKVENQGDAWTMSIDSVGRFFERVIVKAKKEKLPKLINKPSIQFDDAPELIQEFIGRGFYERVVRLGQRTAEMHQALASNLTDAAFAPENFTANYQRSLYSSFRKLVRERFSLLENSFSKLDVETKALAKKVLSMEAEVLECLSDIFKIKITGIKSRIHGDYHLGQVLFTGKDFFIIDFEGEPGFSFGERRLKKSPFKDVAGMMRSFHYAAFGKLLLNENYRDRDLQFLEAWAEQWQHYVSRFYLGAYMERMGMGTTLSEENDLLIRIFLLEKAIYELGYELNGRPDWVSIPLKGIDYHLSRYTQEKEARKKKSNK